MATLPSGLSEAVEDEEDLARFLTSSSQYSRIMVKPAAFLPNPRNGRTSTFRQGREPLERLWQTGREFAVGDRPLHGAAIVKAGKVRAAQLDVVASEPPPRHADIIGWAWSPSDPDLGKAERKERAALVAQRAELVRREPSA